MTSSGLPISARLLGVFVDEGVDALDQRVLEALLDGAVAPGFEVGFDLLARRPRRP
jgi:hypothetical protein